MPLKSGCSRIVSRPSLPILTMSLTVMDIFGVKPRPQYLRPGLPTRLPLSDQCPTAPQETLVTPHGPVLAANARKSRVRVLLLGGLLACFE